MSEREFLKIFLQFNDVFLSEDRIDKFLDYLHSSYFEVEFVKKEYEDQMPWAKTNPLEMNARVEDIKFVDCCIDGQNQEHHTHNCKNNLDECGLIK